MLLSTAQSLGWNLARTMMTIIVLIETSRAYSVMPLARRATRYVERILPGSDLKGRFRPKLAS